MANVESDVPEPNIGPLDGDLRQVRLIDPTQNDGWIFNGVASDHVSQPVHPVGMPTRARREGAGTDAYPEGGIHHMSSEPVILLAKAQDHADYPKAGAGCPRYFDDLPTN